MVFSELLIDEIECISVKNDSRLFFTTDNSFYSKQNDKIKTMFKTRAPNYNIGAVKK